MGPRESLRGWLGQALGTVMPALHDRAFERQRDQDAPLSRYPRGGFPRRPFHDRPPRVLVVAQEGPSYPSWSPGTRNFYFEAWKSGRERWGDPSVLVLDVPPGERPENWHHRVIDVVRDEEVTHVLCHLENDPGNSDSWTWDALWTQLAPRWDGAFIGVMFDSAYRLVTMKARRLARISPQFVAVDICTSLDGVLVRDRSEVGPVNMPMSHESLDLLDQRLSGLDDVHDVSFIGALYPYRLELIQELRSQGVDVAVNPHRPDVTHDFVSSRRDQPSWLDYMAGLAQSRMTINFSRSSAGDFEQLKTRVLEAGLAGTLLLTDDRMSTRQFFDLDEEFAFFESVHDLPTVVRSWLDDPSRLAVARQRARAKARELARTSFWGGIARGLDRRELPALPPHIM